MSLSFILLFILKLWFRKAVFFSYVAEMGFHKSALFIKLLSRNKVIIGHVEAPIKGHTHTHTHTHTHQQHDVEWWWMSLRPPGGRSLSLQDCCAVLRLAEASGKNQCVPPLLVLPNEIKHKSRKVTLIRTTANNISDQIIAVYLYTFHSVCTTFPSTN